MRLTVCSFSYSIAINTAATLEEARLAHLNRSLVNSRLGRFENALADAVKAIQNGKTHDSEKALFREAKALYAMKDYRECMKTLVFLAKKFPDNQAVKPELDRAQARLREQLKGVYSFRQMYKEAKAGIPIIDQPTLALLRYDHRLVGAAGCSQRLQSQQVICCFARNHFHIAMWEMITRKPCAEVRY